MVWHLELAFRWLRRSASLLPISVVNFLNGRFPEPRGQSTFELYFLVPPHVPTISWYSGSFGNSQSGSIIYVKPHFHMNLMKKSFLFAGTGDSVGLTAAQGFVYRGDPVPRDQSASSVRNTLGFDAPLLPLADAPFSTFDELEAYLRHKAESVLKCVFLPNHIKAKDGACYDRAPTVQCSPWHVGSGDSFTSVTFLHYDYGMPDSECSTEPWVGSRLPAQLPMHTEMFFFLAPDVPNGALPSQSCYYWTAFIPFGKLSISMKEVCSTTGVVFLESNVEPLILLALLFGYDYYQVQGYVLAGVALSALLCLACCCHCCGCNRACCKSVKMAKSTLI